MLSVAICDDEPAVCREIEELLAGHEEIIFHS